MNEEIEVEVDAALWAMRNIYVHTLVHGCTLEGHPSHLLRFFTENARRTQLLWWNKHPKEHGPNRPRVKAKRPRRSLMWILRDLWRWR